MMLEFLPKIKTIGNLHIKGSILPAYLVSDNNLEIVFYLTEWGSDYTLNKYYKENMDDGNLNAIAIILNNLKHNILALHRNGIIHGDIHDDNVLVDSNTNTASIIDFDNCAYKNFKMNPDYCTWFASDYINKYGINKELDVFLFNYLTVMLMNKLADYYSTEEYIIHGENKYFKENDDYKNICDTLLLEAKKPSDKFLIDNYQKVLK